MLTCQDLLTSVMEVNNESTHTANLDFSGSEAGIGVKVYKTDETSPVIFEDSVALTTTSSRSERSIVSHIEYICARLDVIVRNDYANQHSLEPKREVRHA
ncbi:hypothetical protein BUE76_11680 [Cnuella takakiae]|nr:hypothetical protein BUE76_11680 [Cnuella takakiae]